MKLVLSVLRRLDRLFDRHVLLFALLLLVVALRLPNLSEPYWYGDEGIYLTIGQTLNRGATLYSEIVDHKTPVIYWLAQVGTQLNFRLVLIGWMLAATTLFYQLSRQFFRSQWQVALSGLFFVLLTSLPALEGNIPNGELFVIGWVLLGAVLLWQTPYAQALTSFTKTDNMPTYAWLLVAGAMFGLGILTKVPALFDVAAFAFIGFLTVDVRLSLVSQLKKAWVKSRAAWMMLGLGVFLPILGSIFYFVLKGAGQDYLQFGLLYNIYYAGSWQLKFDSALVTFLFSLPGKTLMLTAGLTLVWWARRWLTPQLSFLVAWLLLALYASLLSNRPYPHYFLQIIPPLALLVGQTALLAEQVVSGKKAVLGKQAILGRLGFILGLFGLVLLIGGAIGLRPYPTFSYYKNWYLLQTNQLSTRDYYQGFNRFMNDNYSAAWLFRSKGVEELFIWGTNPMLYALADAKPTGRFTVSFHIKDLDVFDETLLDLQESHPPFVVVMHNEKHPFPEFYAYLNAFYIPDERPFEHFTVWKRVGLE